MDHATQLRDSEEGGMKMKLEIKGDYDMVYEALLDGLSKRKE